MEHFELLQKENRILKHLSGIPRRLMHLQGVENSTEFVFHDLCARDCFDFDRAAFFVDNPDFKCTKGVAGFDRDQAFDGSRNIWDDTKEFSDHMRSSPFNILVRSITRCGFAKGEAVESQLAEELAGDLGFKNYAYCSWTMRHHNRGLVVYERERACDVATQETILDGLSVLSFCPIF